MMSQQGKLLNTALKKDTTRGRVSNEKQQMANTMLLAFVDAPSCGSDDGERLSVPSNRRQLQSLDGVSHTTGLRKMKQLAVRRAVLRHGVPSKKDWNLFSSRKGKGLKAKEEVNCPTQHPSPAP